MQKLRSARWRHDHRRPLKKATAIGVAASLAVGLTAAAALADGGFGNSRVGTDDGRGILLPTNQRITPIGDRLLVDDARLVSSSVSPDGRYLAALSWNTFTGFLTIVDLETNKIVQQIGTGKGTDKAIGDGTVAADGPTWAADGRTLWFPQTKDLVRFDVAPTGQASNPQVITLQTGVTDLNHTTTDIPDMPSGMALSGDGRKLYVALNNVNQLATIDTATNKVIAQTKVGNAPRQVQLIGNQAFVTNEGGRPAQTSDVTNDSSGTKIVSDPSTGAATTGTVSVVDVALNRQVKAIKVGLQPTAMFRSPDGALFVANSNDDSFSVINPATGAVTQTVNTNPVPGARVGSYPNAFTMPDPHTLLVSIGRDNALAVYRYDGALKPVRYVGLLPTDFYPVNATWDAALGKVVVTNDKGIGSRGPTSSIDKGPGTTPAPSSVTGHNTYADTGTLTSFAMPSSAQVGNYTHQVFVDNNWLNMPTARPSTTGAAPAAIPAHLGDPSKIQHVFLIVRENRTYDQVLGDIGKGNSDPSLAQFGQPVTPNAHKLANTYGVNDNFYDEGTLSADGHNWLMQADANDYIEKEFGAFYRSYPAQGGDALAYQRDGFLWNAIARSGGSTKAFGEYNNFITQPSPKPSWSDYYKDSQIMEGKASGPMPVAPSSVNTYSDIPSLNAIDDHRFPAFDLGIPDQYRADIWQQSFDKSVKSGQLANLNMIWMPVDHTSGVGSGNPNPVAQVADNDLAVGRMIDRISHSRFWKNSAVFVVEDDSQNGVDHVDGHRAPLLVASPYAKRGAVTSTYYSQINLVKTIEQILGVAPMNQEDRAATPMFDLFTNQANTVPYTHLPNTIPLDQGVAPAPTTRNAAPNAAAQSFAAAPQAQAGSVPASQKATYDAWVAWSKQGRFSGPGALVDFANPAQLNRLDWYSAHAWTVPFPGDAAILRPDQVPGRQLPAGYLGDS